MDITIKHVYGDWHECECCGSYTAEGIFIYVNNVLIWKKYHDGHLYGEQTESSILDSFLTYYKETKCNEIEKDFTEEKRLQWNLDHPGNAIARTTEAWLDYKNSKYSYVDSTIEYLREVCDKLPYREELQIQMIGLWLEDDSGEKVNINIMDVHENEIYPI